MLTDDLIIQQTKQWLNEIVIGLNFCPFAKNVFDQELVYYKVVISKNLEEALAVLIDECQRLDHDNKIETTLIIFPDILSNFDDYLDFVALANQLLDTQNYTGVYQLASFHPDYCFNETDVNAAENYTNRSPYPMLHLLRESTLEKALKSYAEPEKIPIHNIETAKKKGRSFFIQTLNKIKNL